MPESISILPDGQMLLKDLDSLNDVFVFHLFNLWVTSSMGGSRGDGDAMG